MLYVLRMLLMGVHFILAGLLGLLLGLCRPFNPDNSRLCARLYSLPALRLLRLQAAWLLAQLLLALAAILAMPWLSLAG